MRKFTSKQFGATPGALAVLDKAGVHPRNLLERHFEGDWGECCDEDKEVNEEALKTGGQLMSVFVIGKTDELPMGERVWVITDPSGIPKRHLTTIILLPEDY